MNVESSPPQSGEALLSRDCAAAERLGARLPTPRLTHLGAGGLVRVEIAFFSWGRETADREEGRLEVRLVGIW